ncbi:MAG: CRISPR-associated endonuclease Cas2 [Clostridiaceae bacterium]|jgi:CRISPR-associated protein Cas2|nr:CRISPR-associated endonuclease Cas2 [Clostridiaceae bacterium]
MFVLITYDVAVTTDDGKKRLRAISRECQNYGQRVQNSVFECILQYSTYKTLQKKLLSIMDKSADSLRFYVLGNSYKEKVEHYGAKPGYDPEGPLII